MCFSHVRNSVPRLSILFQHGHVCRLEPIHFTLVVIQWLCSNFKTCIIWSLFIHSDSVVMTNKDSCTVLCSLSNVVGAGWFLEHKCFKFSLPVQSNLKLMCELQCRAIRNHYFPSLKSFDYWIVRELPVF